MKPVVGLIAVTLSLTLSCKGKDKEGTEEKAKPAPTSVPSGSPDEGKPRAWTAEQTLVQLGECDKAMNAIDEAAIKSCYDDAFDSRLLNEVFPEVFPDEVGSQVHLDDADDLAAFFDGTRDLPLLVATATRAAQIHLLEGTMTEKFPFKAAHGKSVVLATAKLTRLDEKGRLVSEVLVRDQAAFGNQTGVYKSPMVSVPFEKWAAPIAVAASGSDEEKANLKVVRDAHAALTGGDSDKFAGYFAEAAKGWEPLGASEGETLASRKEAAARTQTRFKEMNEEVVEEFAAKDWVVQLIRSRVVVGDKGMPKMPEVAGKSFDLTELRFTRLENGLIKEGYGFYNVLSLQQQLGLFDPTETKKLFMAARADMAKKKTAADAAKKGIAK